MITFIARETVLRMIPRKTVFSHSGDVANAHNLYCVGTCWVEIVCLNVKVNWDLGNVELGGE